jgi:hypothetical protein
VSINAHVTNTFKAITKNMKTLFIILFLSISCYAQELRNNYIIANNFASEGEYFFHEENYDSAAYFYEKSFGYISEPHPRQSNNYAKALWKIKKYDLSIEMLLQYGEWKIDTSWFSGLSEKKYDEINAEMHQIYDQRDKSKNCSFYNSFMDSIIAIDQFHRKTSYPNDSIKRETMSYFDSCNAQAIIQFTKKFGFPAGVNACWNQTAATFLLHMSSEWFVENYVLLYKEVVKGNLEPWMLAKGIDRLFTIEIGEDKVNPFNRYWNESTINPFLMFYNCVSLGVSPYYDFNWFGKPRKTIHFDYYKENKKQYNTTFEYTHNSK